MKLAMQAGICPLAAWSVAKPYSINRTLVFPNNVSSRLFIFNPSHLPTLSWPLGINRDVC